MAEHSARRIHVLRRSQNCIPHLWHWEFSTNPECPIGRCLRETQLRLKRRHLLIRLSLLGLRRSSKGRVSPLPSVDWYFVAVVEWWVRRVDRIQRVTQSFVWLIILLLSFADWRYSRPRPWPFPSTTWPALRRPSAIRCSVVAMTTGWSCSGSWLRRRRWLRRH